MGQKNRPSGVEGLLNFYVATYITLQTSPQECFFVRFVCFIVIIAGAKLSLHRFPPK
jgi:hypothetical protein